MNIGDTVENVGVITAIYPDTQEVDINGKRTKASRLLSLSNGNFRDTKEPTIDTDVTPGLTPEEDDTVWLEPMLKRLGFVVSLTKDTVTLDTAVTIPIHLLEYRQINRGWNFKQPMEHK